ncbi:uncharacterized protein LOC143997803 isoform X2 [Lithobates pipiens]
MRTLPILGGLVVCVLLVTPSNGDQTESHDGGGEQEPSSPNKPTKRKRCPGCYSSLSIDDPVILHKRSRRQEEKMTRDTKPKRSKKLRVAGTEGLEGKPKPDFGTLERAPKDEGRRERKKNGRKRGRWEKEERKSKKHHHHHHHPEGKKEEKKAKRTGSRSAITSTYGERKDASDGKEVSERMKRQSEKGNRRKGKEERWRSGSRSSIASLSPSKTRTVLSLA